MTERHRAAIASLPPSRFGAGTHVDSPGTQFSLRRVGAKLYFLNHTAGVVQMVRNSSVGLVRTDDEGSAATTSEFTIVYEMVQPGEAVLIDEFDDYIDSDPVICTFIDVQVEGETQSVSVFGKGGARSKVLKRLP